MTLPFIFILTSYQRLLDMTESFVLIEIQLMYSYASFSYLHHDLIFVYIMKWSP